VVVNEGSSADVEWENKRLSSVNIQGRDEDWPLVSGGDVSPGRSFTRLEAVSNARVVVVNAKLAEQLFGDRDPIGRSIRIGACCTTIGVHNLPTGLFGEGDYSRR
jgi:putative ABC transport system permease protein